MIKDFKAPFRVPKAFGMGVKPAQIEMLFT